MYELKTHKSPPYIWQKLKVIYIQYIAHKYSLTTPQIHRILRGGGEGAILSLHQNLPKLIYTIFHLDKNRENNPHIIISENIYAMVLQQQSVIYKTRFPTPRKEKKVSFLIKKDLYRKLNLIG